MHSPLTIVIPVHNRAHTLERTLGSIDAQTLRPAEVILVDNGSTDGSMEVMSAWAKGKDYVKVLSELKPGACAARNRGLGAVRTEWTMFFDSDDVMHPSHVQDFTEAIASHQRADVLGRDIITRFIDGNGRRLYFKGGRNAMFHHLFRGCLSTQRYVARTELFRRAGGWDERLSGWNDFELGVRILLMGCDIVDIGGNPTVTTYQQHASITGTSFSANPEQWERSLRVIHEHFMSLPPEDACRSRYLRWLDARAMILAAQYQREARVVARDSEEYRRVHLFASRLYDEVMARAENPVRLRLIYLHNLYFGRLTWLLAL